MEGDVDVEERSHLRERRPPVLRPLDPEERPRLLADGPASKHGVHDRVARLDVLRGHVDERHRDEHGGESRRELRQVKRLETDFAGHVGIEARDDVPDVVDLAEVSLHVAEVTRRVRGHRDGSRVETVLDHVVGEDSPERSLGELLQRDEVDGAEAQAFAEGAGALRIASYESCRLGEDLRLRAAVRNGEDLAEPVRILREAPEAAEHAEQSRGCMGLSLSAPQYVSDGSPSLLASAYRQMPELIERHMKSMLAVLATTAREGETSSIEEATRTIIRAVFAAHRVNPKLHRVLVEQMARLGTLEAVESFEAQAQALVEAFLTAHRAELRPKNVKAAARVAVLAVRGVTLWTVLRNAEQLADDEFIDENTDMVTRYLVKRAGG